MTLQLADAASRHPFSPARIDTAIRNEVPVHDGSVQLPDGVRRMIEERAEAVGFAAVKCAASAMSAAYRESRAVRLPDPARTAAYLVTRMPATFAAAYAAGTMARDIPSNHSPRFAPLIQPTLDTGVAALVTAAATWMPVS